MCIRDRFSSTLDSTTHRLGRFCSRIFTSFNSLDGLFDKFFINAIGVTGTIVDGPMITQDQIGIHQKDFGGLRRPVFWKDFLLLIKQIKKGEIFFLCVLLHCLKTIAGFLHWIVGLYGHYRISLWGIGCMQIDKPLLVCLGIGASITGKDNDIAFGLIAIGIGYVVKGIFLSIDIL